MEKYSCIILFSMLHLLSCVNPTADTVENTSGSQGDTMENKFTHFVSCSNVHVRTEPNSATISKGLLPQNTQVIYQGESFFSETIPIKNRRQPEKWMYISYTTSEKTIEYGWVYGGCLAELPNTNYLPKVNSKLYLTNRHFVIGDREGDCDLDGVSCTVWCPCDCCAEDYYFLPNGRVIVESFCCCINPTYYYIGTYGFDSKGYLVCRFKSTSVVDYSTNIDPYPNPMPVIRPVYEKLGSFSHTFKVKMCANELVYLEESSTGGIGNFREPSKLSVFLSEINKNGVFSMLNKLVD